MEAPGGSGAEAGHTQATGAGGRNYAHLRGSIAVPEELLSPMNQAVVLLATIVFTGLSLSAPLAIMALVPGCSWHDPRCFDYGREMMLTASDPQEEDPCNDFHSYVCSNFAELYPSRSSFLALLEAKLSAFRSHVLDEHPVGASDEVGRHVIVAFRKCVEEYRRNYDSLLPLRLLLRSAGIHWTQRASTQSHQDTLGIVLRLSLKYGVPVLLHASLRPSLKETPDNRLVLSLEFRVPRFPQGGGERTVSAIEGSLRLVGHNSTGVSRFRRSALSTMRHMRALMSHLKAASRWEGGLAYVKFSQVQEKLLSFVEPTPFLGMTNAALHEAKKEDYFRQEDEMVTSTPTLIAAFSKFVAAAKATALLRLVRYLVIESLLPVSSGNLADIYGVDERAAFHLRADACAREAIGVMPRAWEHLLYEERLEQRCPRFRTLESILSTMRSLTVQLLCIPS
ncbi:uncharacterized protein LOC144108498 [Amblyomma americanum]